jgi:hypothetical protein
MTGPTNRGVQFQICIDAGARAAAAFFHDMNGLVLHDHIAESMFAFSRSVLTGLDLVDADNPVVLRSCTDAFAAGYLGRIHQELRLFRGERGGAPEG